MGVVTPTTASCVSPLQFVPLEMAKPEHRHPAPILATRPNNRIEVIRGDLQLKLHCAASDGPAYAALLRALPDTGAVV
jgi:hypothetical protein